MAKTTTNYSETGLYKNFLELLKFNTNFFKNIDRSYQMMYSYKTSDMLISGTSFFLAAFNTHSVREKLQNIENIKNQLLSYDVVVRVLLDCKVMSPKQGAFVGESIAKIQKQLAGFERKCMTMLNNNGNDNEQP